MKILIDVEFKNETEGQPFSLRSRMFDVFNKDELQTTLNQLAQDIEVKIENHQAKYDDNITDIEKITIHYDRYNPTKGSSYIQLPEWIKLKYACINIKNDDNRCLKYSIQCGVFNISDNSHPERISHYNKLTDNVINWEHMKYPAGNNDIDKLEQNNKGILSVNVYEVCNQFDKDIVILHRRTKNINAKHHINLLKIYEGNKYHYVYIKNYDRLIGCQTNNDQKNKYYHCMYCQHGFKKEKTLQQHLQKGCMAVEGQSVKLPKEGDTIKFKNNNRKFKCPIAMYSDFECVTEEIENNSNETNTDASYTKKYQKHKP